MKIKYVLFIFMLMTMSHACKKVDEDLAAICDKSNEVMSDSTMSIEEKTRAFTSFLTAMESSGDTQKFINDLVVKESVSYNDFKAFAQENGLQGWECVALREFLQME